MHVHEPKWGNLPDDVLSTLGAKDSLAAATSAISTEARAWGVYNSNEGLVIASDTVVDFVSPDGMVHVDDLHHWLTAVAAGHHEQASTADRFAAAMNLLGHAIRIGNQELKQQAQNWVSGHLVNHPVLLHPRLVIPFRAGMERHHESVLGAMLRTKDGALPSASHGVPEEKMAVFARSPLLEAPMTRNAPKKAYTMGGARHPWVEVSLQGKVLEKMPYLLGNPHPALLASLLEIGALRTRGEPTRRWPYSPSGLGADQRNMLRQAFGHAAGLYYHAGRAGFAKRERTP